MASVLDKETITLKDAVAHMRTGAPFNITYTEADRRRGTGGTVTTLKGWCIHTKKGQTYNSDIQNRKSRIAQALYKCNPNHWKNKTANITNLKSRAILTIHLKLINEYNGKTVVL